MKSAIGVARPRGSGDPETQLQGFIDKFDPGHQAIIHAVRKALRRRLPNANELVYDNCVFRGM